MKEVERVLMHRAQYVGESELVTEPWELDEFNEHVTLG